MQLYVSNYVGQSLSDYKMISEGIWISKVTTLSLKDYCNARKSIAYQNTIRTAQDVIAFYKLLK